MERPDGLLYLLVVDDRRDVGLGGALCNSQDIDPAAPECRKHASGQPGLMPHLVAYSRDDSAGGQAATPLSYPGPRGRVQMSPGFDDDQETPVVGDPSTRKE